ncbi:hypothetical protein [Alicyclobacillus macrosporangiidus]|uniref:Uncharacterized protein n=1 Tax=Alicyclobacillus macrosporangiidus TaxID=392015 RepID=A0A1I7L8U6_9BACL|nr:hypothetical protein [Alicyclobacillus macrosporangiidus]SFV06159.1 hypothetical protein SAMN05421543_1293 [Alicyclobacillus macrosporangiidus]
MRLTRHYTVTIHDGVAVLHHAPHPLWPWYWMDTERYFREREKAYRRLAESGRPDIREVRGYSLWIDYARDGFEQHTEPVRFWRDQMGLISVWLFNVYNWRTSRVGKLARLLRRDTVNVGVMDWETFVRTYGA